jgi:hypothetical protein
MMMMTRARGVHEAQLELRDCSTNMTRALATENVDYVTTRKEWCDGKESDSAILVLNSQNRQSDYPLASNWVCFSKEAIGNRCRVKE